MATKTATRQVEIVVVEAAWTFGFNGRSAGEVVRVVGVEYMEGVEIARFGERYREICDTCQGSGFRPEYAGIFGGQCFYCKGSGLRELIGAGDPGELVKVLVRRAKSRERYAAKREAKFAAAAAAHKVWLVENPHIREIADRFGSLTHCEHEADCYREPCQEKAREVRNTHDPLLLELAGYASCRLITEAQTELLIKVAAEHEVRAAAHAVKTAKVAERKYLGAVGEKVAVTGTLAKPWWSEGDYGTSTLYKLTTAEGDVVTWFRTGFHEFEAGATVTLTGAVKKLRETKEYGKETQLTRCKIS